MYKEAELVLHSYHPLYIEKGMYFVRHVWPGSDREYVELWKLEEDIKDNEDVFIAVNGAPVHLAIVSLKYPYNIIAYTEDIAWFDEGDESEDLHDITLKEIKPKWYQ